jgi:hypothetical protein
MNQRPVVHRSQYCLGSRWSSQIADEDNLENRKHRKVEREDGDDLRADRGSRADE